MAGLVCNYCQKLCIVAGISREGVDISLGLVDFSKNWKNPSIARTHGSPKLGFLSFYCLSWDTVLSMCCNVWGSSALCSYQVK